MFILWKYIVKEHISPFFFGLGILTMVFLLNLIFRDLGRILSRGLSVGVILEFFALNLAWILALAIPMAVLIATLMAFGRLSGDGEITAMKAGGVSIPFIITPVLILAIVMAFFLVWFNNNVLPDANFRTKLLWSDIAHKRPTLRLEPGVVYKDIEGYSILVKGLHETPDTSFVKDIYIEDNSEPNKSTFIFAERGKIFLNQKTGMLNLLLFEGEMHELDLKEMEEYKKVEFPRQLQKIHVPDMIMTRSNEGQRGDREKSAQMMRAEVRENKESIQQRRSRAAKLVRGYFAKYLPPPFNDPTARVVFDASSANGHNKKYSLRGVHSDNIRLKQQVRSEMMAIKRLDRANYGLMVEVHKKYSIPVACIIFILVGAPLGIMARRGNMAVAGGIAFAFFLIYWSCLIGGEELANNQIISPVLSMWIANILCGAAGIYLVFHAIYETTFINWTRISDFFTRLFRQSKVMLSEQ